LISVDGSESKPPTISNLDFNEIRRKSRIELSKFDEKSIDEQIVRS
jgi:hypothetical protein